MFSSRVFAEPELEFGDGGRHQDPRVGLMEHGPLQPILKAARQVGKVLKHVSFAETEQTDYRFYI